jgi:D-alanyl-D-alanine carboxypeptidase
MNCLIKQFSGMMRWSAILLAFPIILSACSLHRRGILEPETEPPIPYGSDFQRALEGSLEENAGINTIGISAAVSVPGHKPWVGVVGHSHPGVSIKADMLFDAGSVAKMFEAALAMRMVEQGLLDLDVPISHWIPELTNLDRNATVRQLLNHTSGIFNVFEHPEFPWVGVSVDYERTWTLEDAFRSFVAEPYGPPGTVQHYSSTNYLLLTEILESIAGERLEDIIEEEFFIPLEMNLSQFSTGEPLDSSFEQVHPWVDLDGDGTLDDLHGEAITWKVTLTHPVLYSTPEDLTRWLDALFRDRSLLTDDSMTQMLTYPGGVKPDPGGALYGLGVVDYTHILGEQAIGHGGSALGYSAAAVYLPACDVSLAWMINVGESPAAMAQAMMGDIWSALYAVIDENCLDKDQPDGVYTE